eukprot:jgi/Tetstr1/421013/TSEL_001096.t1
MAESTQETADVAAHWRDTNPHGKKLAMEARLYDALKEDCPPHTEELPSGRSLLQAAAADGGDLARWRGAQGRQMNDRPVAGTLKQQRDDSPLRKGQAGYAVWTASTSICYCWAGWDARVRDEDDPLCPMRSQAARADNRKEKGGRAAERLATATGNRKETLGKACAPEGRSNAPSNGEEAEWEPSQGDEGELPELDQVLELTATEQRLASAPAVMACARQQQLQKLKYVGLLISEAASRSLHERIITSTPERNQKVE